MASDATLPRRLRAERDCVELLGKGCCVVDLAGCERYAIVISSQGVAAIVGDVADGRLVVDADAGGGAPLPAFAIGARSDGTQRWLGYVSGSGGTYEPCPKPRADDVRRGAAKAEGKWPAVIIASIARYYGLQALEPSVRGFLAILEKQFDRADAYVWELLQNGVDDGATQVVVERLSERRGVRVSHDGRRFTPLDVLGLSSVGLSTKSLLSDGNAPRSIGFMGIGFKAVYRRFKRVTVSDGRWRFRYDEPRDRPPGEPKHAWVLRPAALEAENDSTWCAFDLERPRQSIEGDLRPPNASAVAMVGRAAAQRSKKTWTLDWDGRRHAVALTTRKDEETITVEVSKGDTSKTRTFVAFVQGWRPRGAAREAYEAHTKRSHDGNDEELRLFFEVGADETRPGLIHCTLPTRVRAPTGRGTHLDGPFLLSVDRGSLDGTHAWNAALLQNGLGELFAKLLRWAAKACRAAEDQDKAKVLKDAYGRLPALVRDAEGRLSTTVAGAPVALHALDSALKREALLPCLPLGTFKTAREARWVPSAFSERVPAPVLRELFGGAPLATHLLGDAFADPGTWAGVISAPAPRKGVRVNARLVKACGGELAGIGAALLEAAAATKELDEAWPCVLAASTEIVAPGRCRFLDDDVAALPEALRAALEAAASKAVDGTGKDAPRLAHRGIVASSLSRCAQGFLATLRKGRDRIVTVARAAHAAQKGWGAKDAALFVGLVAWAKDSRTPEALSMALDNNNEPKPIHTLALGAAYGDDVSAVAAPAQRRVSEVYLEQGGSQRSWGDFWRSAGAGDGSCRVVATLVRVDARKAAQLVQQAVADAAARSHLREVKFRKSQPSTAVPLPYGLLPEMDKRYAYVVDCRLARAWRDAPKDADAARAFAKALARRLVEGVEVPSAKTVPAARRTFGDAKGPDPLSDGLSPRDAAPLRRRLYWLPPGQAAACAVDLGPAEWVDELAKRPWVPCTWPDGPSCVERPSHVALKKEEDGRRPIVDFGGDDAMIRRALCGSTSPWAARLAWSSEAPPPPLDALLALLKSDAPDVDALTAAWLRVGRGASELDRQGARDLASAARRSQRALPSGSAALPLDRCVVIAGEPDDLTRSLLSVGFLEDVARGPLAAVADALGSLLRLVPAASRDHALRYVRNLGDAAPERLAVPELDALAETTAAAARRGLDVALPCRKLDGTGTLVWLRGSDAIVVDDDGQDGARRHCLQPSLGYLPLALFERDRRRAAAVADALGLPRLSKWPLRTTATGTVARLDEASGRFALVLRLLGDTGENAPGVYRRGGLKRELTAPNGRTAASQLHALWGRVRDVDGAQLLVAGDGDDYAPAAEELALGRANVTFADARVRDVLRLLGALEDERRFLKLSSRLTAAADAAVLGAFRADAALDAADTADAVETALQEHGARASTAAVDRATATIARLRAVEADIKRERDKERAEEAKKRKLMADADSLLSSVRAEAAAESEDEAEPVVNNGVAPALGRGRGVTNLPAWMTAGVPTPAEPAAPEPPAPPAEPAVLNGGAPPVLVGRGRGVSNLSAWMAGDAPREKRGRDGDAELPDAKRPALAAHGELHASMLRVARADPDAFDSLVADVWGKIGK